MSHVRTQIRNALVTLLAGVDSTDGRVYVSRLHPLPADKLPALRVFVDEEEITATTIHNPVMLQRRLIARIECVSAMCEGLDDDIDQIALEVEHAIAADGSLGGILNGLMAPTGMEVDRNGEGSVPVGTLTLSYLAEYEVDNNAVGTPL